MKNALRLQKVLRNKFGIFFLILIGGLIIFTDNHPALTYAAHNSNPWLFRGKNTTSEKYITLDADALQGRDTLRLTYNLHGTCLEKGNALIIFDQPVDSDWHSVSLSDYGQNCKRGEQTVDIPLSDFPDLDLNAPVGKFHVKFFNIRNYAIDITGATLFDSGDSSIDPLPSPSSQPSPSSSLQPRTPSPAPSVSSKPSPSPKSSLKPFGSPSPSASPSLRPSSSPIAGNQDWEIQSVSSMKITKDMVCNQPDEEFVNNWLDRAKELGANYVSIETPYENPYCGNSLDFTNQWVDAIRNHGLKVWHRHMPLGFEGIYDTDKTRKDYLQVISDYIKKNPLLFQSGDIFTPIPEPQNGGISGISYCASDVCQFDSASQFNLWLRNAIDTSNQAFKMIGLDNQIKVGYYGLDGFITWGDNNPDWDGILEDATVSKMGNLTIDHYPELIGENMADGLNELQAKYPNVPIVIGEWGAVNEDNQIQQVDNSMGAAKRPGVVGFNYWHLGMGGFESLIEDDFLQKPTFFEVQKFFLGQK